MRMKILLFINTLVVLAVAAFAQGPRQLGAQETLATGDIVSFVSLAAATNGAHLEGRRGNETIGRVGWRLGDLGEKSVTRWRVEETARDIFAFQCTGFVDDPAWLDGFTPKGYVVLRLSPSGVSGASWAVYRDQAGYNLKCLGRTRGARWLAAAPQGAIALALDTDTPATRWQIIVWRKANL